MCSCLQKPKSSSVDAMSSRLEDLNNYLTSFPLPDNKSFSQGEMIEIVLSMLPAVWVNSMTTAGLEPREKTYKELIEHLEKLARSLPDEPIPKKKESKEAAYSTSTTSIHKKYRPEKKPRVHFGKGKPKGNPQ